MRGGPYCCVVVGVAAVASVDVEVAETNLTMKMLNVALLTIVTVVRRWDRLRPQQILGLWLEPDGDGHLRFVELWHFL